MAPRGLVNAVAAGGLVLAPGPSYRASNVEVVDLALGAEKVAQTGEQYICATTDWWPPEKCDYGTCGWTNAPYGGNPSIINLDIKQPLFQKALDEMSPFIWRLGGSLQDHIIYEEPGTDLACPPMTVDPDVKFGFSGGCLLQQRWHDLATLAKDKNLSLVFGLNELVGRTHVQDKQWTGDWNPSNAKALMQYTKDQNLPMFGWELGNELGGWNGIAAQLTPEEVGKDFITLRNMVTEIYGEEDRPLVIGPDTSLDIPWYTAFFNTVKSNIDAVTIHLYALGAGVDPNLINKIMDPAHTKEAKDEAATLAKLALDTLGADAVPQLWMGEDGGAYNSGQNGTTNRYTAGFWSLNELGIFARAGFSVYCRQTLLGGNYGLLDKDTLHPNPDFYNYKLFNTLMGPEVLDITSPADDLTAYAHCTRGGEAGAVTVLLINFSKEKDYQIGSLKVGDQDLIQGPRQDYLLTSPGVLNGTIPYLNGEALQLSDAGDYPALTPKVIDDGDGLILPSTSYGFFVFLKAGLAACTGAAPPALRR